MNFKMLFLLIAIATIMSPLSGCLEGKTVVVEKEILNEGSVIGIWVQNSTNISLVFLEDHTYYKLTPIGDSKGTWRIEYNDSLVLKAETYGWNSSSHSYDQFQGTNDVSDGKIKKGVLTLTSGFADTGDPYTDFPSGNYIPM